ncbi:HNH endonuclease [Nonomuraea jiangxiensis]|uniref:HNH endonuclease signature motif containing protein n=1 Tax=Nonomuraea jiangxiensis TaxID=633440 RepID=UPI000B868BB7|nr:HNH endonuclease [Nonomuraea jiangxiensis]
MQLVLKRDGSCRWLTDGQLCGSVERLEVDHIDDPTDHDLSNLRALCHEHHKLRTQAQITAGVRAYYTTRSRKRPDEPHPGLIKK